MSLISIPKCSKTPDPGTLIFLEYSGFSKNQKILQLISLVEKLNQNKTKDLL